MRDSYSKDHDKFSKLDDPPNSRLFVAQIKDVSEEELRESFGQYGEVEDVWICKDKHTGEPKSKSFKLPFRAHFHTNKLNKLTLLLWTGLTLDPYQM